MAKTFAGNAAEDVRALGNNLRGVADGFRDITQAASSLIELRKENLGLARQELGVQQESAKVPLPRGSRLGQRVRVRVVVEAGPRQLLQRVA